MISILTILSDIPPFMIRAILAATGLAFMAGPLGCFLVWRQMAFFGDALSHAALLGVAIALFFHVNIYVGVGCVCALLAIVLSQVKSHQGLSHDTWMGMTSYAALASGMVALSLSGQRVDPEALLFGDILAVSYADLWWILAVMVIACLFLKGYWRSLLLMTFNEDIAQSSGVAVKKLNTIFMIIMAMVVAVSLKTVGALLVTALFIIPAAGSSQQARSPEGMVYGAIGLSLCALYGGLWTSMLANTPTGPSIIVCASLLFLLCLGVKKWRE